MENQPEIKSGPELKPESKETPIVNIQKDGQMLNTVRTKTTAAAIIATKQEITTRHFADIGMCLQALCNKCGGRSISNCKCAKLRYFNSITQEMIDRYDEKKDSLDGRLLMKYVNNKKIEKH